MKFLFNLLFGLLITNTQFAQACIGNITFETQADVNQFLIDNPTCTSIDGDLIIGTDFMGDPISDLSGLQNITSISGNLDINVKTNMSLLGLSNLTTITGDLIITDDANPDLCGLYSLEGLENLQSVHKLWLYNCQALTEITPVYGITDVYAIWIWVFQNLDLSNLFPNVAALDGGFSLSGENFELYSFSNVTMFSGFDALVTCGGLDFDAVYIDEFDAFHNLVSTNAISSWASTILTMSGFENLTSSSLQLVFEHTGFNLPDFNSLIDADIVGIHVAPPIDSLALELPTFASLETTDIFYLWLTSDSISYPGITSVGSLSLEGIYNNAEISFSSLQHIGALNLTGLGITDFSGFPVLETISGSVYINSNSNLSNCYAQALCERLAVSLDGITIYDNAIGCNTPTEATSDCNYSAASGKVFADFDCDGIFNNNDIGIYNSIIHDGTSLPIGISYANGNYVTALPDNSTVTLSAVTPVGFTGTTSHVVTTLADDTNYGDLNFPMCPVENNHNISINLGGNQNMRPGHAYTQGIFIYNNGSYIESGNVTLDISDMPGVTAVQYSGGVLTDNSITWNVMDLQPFSWTQLQVMFHVIETGLEIGTNFSSNAIFEYADASIIDVIPSDNTDLLSGTVNNSWDPNYKAVDKTAVLYDDFENGETLSLEYEIHFQNTGNAEAINVRLEDDFPANLDLSTLQMIAFSHPFQLSFDGNHVEWLFENIHLPDSASNEAASQGFVKFRVNSIGNHSLDDTIQNEAAIYFDFNEPVITEPATTFFYTCPITPTIQGISNVCEGNDATLFASQDWTNYEWMLNNETVGTENQFALNSAVAGTYHFIVNTSTEYCTDSAFINVTVTSTPSTPVLTANNNLITSSGNGIFNWTLNGITIGEHTSTIEITESGIYGVTVENIGCTSEMATGNFQYVGIDETALNAQISITPNPMSTNSTVTWNGNSGKASTLIICDQTGRKIIERKMNSNTTRIDRSELSAGIYFVMIWTIEEEVIMEKLVVR